MKRILISLIAITSFMGSVRSQQIAPFNQYTEYSYLYNPAYVGIDTISSVLMLYRNQWSGLNGAPENGLLYVNSQINETAGIGGYILHESANILGSTGAYLSFSYTLNLAPGHTLGFGLAAGIIQKRILFERVRTQNASDPALLDASQSQTKPDGSFGIRYNFKNRLDVSVASQQIFGGTLGFTDESLQNETDFELLRHYYVTTMYSINQTAIPLDLKLIGTIRSVQGLQSQFDLGIRAGWNNTLSTTLLYRQDYGMGVMVGVKIMESLNLGYTYEIPDQTIGLSGSEGTHEISLNLKILNTQ
jgi:type IX secretion system PorP/SprF family membrane protein